MAGAQVRGVYQGAMRVLAALLFALLLATFAPPREHVPEPPPAHAFVSYRAIALDPAEPRNFRFGRLILLGAWDLESNDSRFGGLSAMHVRNGELIAVSDAGSLIRASLPGRPPSARIVGLPAGPGSAVIKGDRDAESLTAHGNGVWIGFERSNTIWRYRGGDDWVPETSARPPLMRKWRSNRGSEAMVRLPDGRFLVFSEGGGGDSPVILFAGDPAVPGTKAVRLVYRPPEGFRITDAALLPGGGLLFLNRKVSFFGGMEAVIGTMAPPKLAPGSLLAGDEVARLAWPLNIDNMEAMSVVREDGRTIVWLASDDNFNPLQRTVLLKFALDLPAKRAKRP